MADRFMTAEVAEMLGVRYTRVYGLIDSGLMPDLARDYSGRWLWSQADVQRARELLPTRRQGRPKRQLECA